MTIREKITNDAIREAERLVERIKDEDDKRQLIDEAKDKIREAKDEVNRLDTEVQDEIYREHEPDRRNWQYTEEEWDARRNEKLSESRDVTSECLRRLEECYNVVDRVEWDTCWRPKIMMPPDFKSIWK